MLKYILGIGLADVYRASSADEATTLHCAIVGFPDSSPEAVKLLGDTAADVNTLDVNEKRLGNLISPSLKLAIKKKLEVMLRAVVVLVLVHLARVKWEMKWKDKNNK